MTVVQTLIHAAVVVQTLEQGTLVVLALID